MNESNVPFRREKNARRQALENLVAVTNHIDASAELLKRSFGLFEDLNPNQIQNGPMEMGTIDNDNKHEDAISFNGKRKHETDGDRELHDLAIKRIKEAEDKLAITQELLRQTEQNNDFETLIINDYGISISRDIDRIINEINNGSTVFARFDKTIMTDDPEITSNVISLSQNYVDDILTANETDSMDLLQLMETSNWRDTENYKYEKKEAGHYSRDRGVCKCLCI